jgi:hypothetical protein
MCAVVTFCAGSLLFSLYQVNFCVTFLNKTNTAHFFVLFFFKFDKKIMIANFFIIYLLHTYYRPQRTHFK